MKKVIICIFVSVFSLLQLNAQKFDWRGGKVRIAVQGGLSWRLDKIAETSSTELKEYLKDLKKGNHLGLDVEYFFTENLGLGVKYNKDMYKGALDNVSIPLNEKLTLTSTTDAININFFGPVFSILSNGETNAFSMNIAYGFITYKNKSSLNETGIDFEGKTNGFAIDLGYELFITHNISFGVQLSYLTGVLDEVRLTTGNFTENIAIDKEFEKEGLNRINISGGLRFYLN